MKPLKLMIGAVAVSLGTSGAAGSECAALTTCAPIADTCTVADDDCLALGGSVVAGECQVAASVIRTGTYCVARPVHILGTGKIDAKSGGLWLKVGGDFVMDGGARIDANDDLPASDASECSMVPSSGSGAQSVRTVSTPMIRSCVSSAARSIKLRSSRTPPGQVRFASTASASDDRRRREPARRRK